MLQAELEAEHNSNTQHTTLFASGGFVLSTVAEERS
jgi:hypothetical protein